MYRLFYFAIILLFSIVSITRHSMDHQREWKRRSLQGLDLKMASPPEGRHLFFVPDYHDGTKYDLSSSLVYMNQSVILSNYVGGIKFYFPKHVNETKEFDPKNPHPQIIVPEGRLWGEDEKLFVWNETILKRNFMRIRNYKPLQQSDCIVCMYLPMTCQYYAAFNKTTIFIPAHRFFLKQCSENQYNHLIRVMTTFPNVHVVASGIYDYHHIRYYTGMKVPIIYSSSLFSYKQPDTYRPTRSEYLVGPFKRDKVPFESELNAYCKNSSLKDCSFTTAKRVFGSGWTIEDLASFKAAILFPYATLSYFMNDLFVACVPIFVPSPRFLNELRLMTAVTATHFCHGSYQISSLSGAGASSYPYNPESEDVKARAYWNQFSTFYSPATTTFDSWEDLMDKLNTVNLTDKFWLRKKENQEIMANNVREWKKLFEVIDPKAEMPVSYEDARAKFGVDEFIGNEWVCLLGR